MSVNTIKKEGKIKFVSKFGGIKFEDDENWYNATGEDFKKEIKSELKGQKAEIDYYVDGDKRKFNAIKVLTESQPQTPPEEIVKDEPMTAGREAKIIRQSCIKAASRSVKMGIDASPDEYETRKKRAIDLAEAFESWVNR